jgi:hypothetical protein
MCEILSGVLIEKYTRIITMNASTMWWAGHVARMKYDKCPPLHIRRP